MTDDANNARQRLLDAALEVFATKGYASASTREICRLAEANVSAIHYYFGDKASLYRQLFERVDQFLRLPDEMTALGLPLETRLKALYRHLLGFTVSAARSQRMRALLVREQLQPTGLLSETQMQGLKPFYLSLLEALKRHLRTEDTDLALQRLTLSLLGLPSMLMIDRDLVDSVSPAMLADREETANQLAQQALALIRYERSRRPACQEATP